MVHGGGCLARRATRARAMPRQPDRPRTTKVITVIADKFEGTAW